MNPIPILDRLEPEKAVLAFAAHPDDLAIGCGGLLLRLKNKGWSGKRMGIVFCGADDPERKKEEAHSCRSLEMSEMIHLSHPDTLLPNVWEQVRESMLEMRERIGTHNIALVLSPRLEDRHQDHRTVAENVWRIFRDHLVLEYEIPKYEGDLGHPNLYLTMTEEEARNKTDLILDHYPSRKVHPWWSRETFMGLMRIRGIESKSAFAEAFYVRKMVF